MVDYQFVIDNYLHPSGKLTLMSKMPKKLPKVLVVIALVILSGIIINTILKMAPGDSDKQLLTVGLSIDGIVIVFLLFQTLRDP